MKRDYKTPAAEYPSIVAFKAAYRGSGVLDCGSCLQDMSGLECVPHIASKKVTTRLLTHIYIRYKHHYITQALHLGDRHCLSCASQALPPVVLCADDYR